MKPFISPNDIHPSLNPFARNMTIADVLDSCLNTDILPNRAMHPFRFAFDPSQASMYVSQRAMKDAEAYSTADESFRYEDALSRLFWQDDDGMDRRRLCVLGPTGSGKSTFVDFFLRWYCPEKSGHGNEFDRKVTVWFDANAAKDNERLTQTFFTSAQAWIRTACKIRGIDINELVRRQNLPKPNAESWVQCALEEVSLLARKPGSGIEYLVIFVDNMDQCPVRIQERLLTTIENWLEMPTMRIWRLILTMWPSTYETLKNSHLNIMRNWKVVRLGAVQPEKLRESRRQVINGRIARALASTAGQGLPSSMHADFQSFLDASMQMWADRFAGSVGEGDESVESESTTAHGLIRELCNADLRREMGLLHGFVTGDGAYRIWQQDRGSTGPPRRHDYEIVESLILGSHQWMMSSADSIGNLFMIGHRQERPRDLLIGPHLLHFLRENVLITEYQGMCKAMADLGYADNNVEHCFAEFRRMGILHEVWSKRHYGVGYEAHQSVLRAYHRLLYLEPAYLDCVAPVSAVDDECFGEMLAAYKARPEAFCRKTEYTLAFLRFLRRIETSFCEPENVREAVRKDFAQRLHAFAVPTLWRHLALRYRNRLTGLRASGYLAHLPHEWWDEAIGSQIFVDATAAKPTLCVA